MRRRIIDGCPLRSSDRHTNPSLAERRQLIFDSFLPVQRHYGRRGLGTFGIDGRHRRDQVQGLWDTVRLWPQLGLRVSVQKPTQSVANGPGTFPLLCQSHQLSYGCHLLDYSARPVFHSVVLLSENCSLQNASFAPFVSSLKDQFCFKFNFLLFRCFVGSFGRVALDETAMGLICLLSIYVRPVVLTLKKTPSVLRHCYRQVKTLRHEQELLIQSHFFLYKDHQRRLFHVIHILVIVQVLRRLVVIIILELYRLCRCTFWSGWYWHCRSWSIFWAWLLAWTTRWN